MLIAYRSYLSWGCLLPSLLVGSEDLTSCAALQMNRGPGNGPTIVNLSFFISSVNLYSTSTKNLKSYVIKIYETKTKEFAWVIGLLYNVKKTPEYINGKTKSSYLCLLTCINSINSTIVMYNHKKVCSSLARTFCDKTRRIQREFLFTGSGSLNPTGV